ncbi:MAG: hypothetical protein WBG16_22230, partial [Bradyrhizobium sp.]|uniref:hypothetical protein n=3 Tax=Bradyrhizobium sp. TaxID=376 RepID=UPI003C7364BD
VEQENMMVKFGRTGAAVLALIGVAASHAQPVDGHQYRRHLHAAPPPVVAYSEEPNLPIENALRWGYSQGYSNYPSGFGGLYGDGRYPGNTVSGPHTYNTLR